MTSNDRVIAAFNRSVAKGNGRNAALLDAARAEHNNVTVGCFATAARDLGFTTEQATLLWQQVAREPKPS